MSINPYEAATTPVKGKQALVANRNPARNGCIYAFCCAGAFLLFSSKLWFLTPWIKLGLVVAMTPFFGAVVLADKLGAGVVLSLSSGLVAAFFSGSLFTIICNRLREKLKVSRTD